MSGWIKFEKDVETDPRVLRMGKALDRRFFLFTIEAQLDPCNATALPGVTLVCGALARLWIFADSHIRDDDTLDMGAAEVDQWLGIPGFCEEMPDDWLREIDEHTIELPGFQAHNGVEAKKRALTQKRVAQHRDNEKRTSVTPSNASALPDQTKTRPDQDHKAMVAARPSQFGKFWEVYPKKVKRKDAEKVWRSKKLDLKAEALIADAIRRSNEDRKWLAGFVPDPTTYLRGERWNDELETPAALKPWVPPPDKCEAAHA